MAMAQIFSPNPITFSATKHVFPFPTNNRHALSPSSPLSPNGKRESLPVPRVASIPYQPVNVEQLKERFSGSGVTFRGLGDGCVAKLAHRNGSAAVVMLPSGLVTSYKAAMWHGGTDEILHSKVVPAAAAAKIQGGVSLPLEFSDEDGVSWFPSNWTLHQITGNSKESIQVELISTDSGDNIEMKYIVTLREDELKLELLISNCRSSSIRLTGCILSHLRVSSPEATYAIGLEASDFLRRPPFVPDFGIIPPDYSQNKGSRVTQLLNKMAFWRPMDQTNSDEKKSEKVLPEEQMEGEETENYKNLGEEMSLIYTSAPRNMTIIDRGRRNSVIVGRKGFLELYMFSPGSGYEMYGQYSYICVGQSAMLKPITVGPEQVLSLGQDLYNPNL